MPAPTPPQSRSRLPALLLVLALLALLLTSWAAWGTPGGNADRGPAAHPAPADMPMGHMQPRDTDRDTGDGHEAASHDPIAGAPEVEVSATEMAFTPDTLTVDAGEPVNLTVTNDGAMFHDFDLEAAEVHLNIDAGEQARTALVIDEPGLYEATCTVPGHASAGMVLTIEVT